MKRILIILIIFNFSMMAQTNFNNINDQIKKGNFTAASVLINEKLGSGTLNFNDIKELKFQLERMDRIKKDFSKSSEDVLKYVKKYYPDADESALKNWRDSGSLEYKVIDGEIKYFNRSQSNLFRINKDAKAQKEKTDGVHKDKLDEFLEVYLPKVVDQVERSGQNLVKPVRMKLNYTLTVNAGAVPGGEIIRCWLPYPRSGHKRQGNIKLISVNTPEYIIADNNHLQRTIYLEKPAESGSSTVFNIQLEYKTFNEYIKIDAEDIKPYNKNSEVYIKYTTERPPHIVFSDKIKTLSEKIVGDEKNPYSAAKKIFTWINNNIPWAGAREYSTIENISDYCLANKHGDCGIKTLLFLTMCRYKGIPTKWQSGWMLHPGQVNLHDWGEIYFEGYGWVPVDQSFGLVDSDDESVKYFYLGGIDAYRLIVNDDYSYPLYPAKIYPRSETVDFQRGEVEWHGGNLYFDKWDYDMQVEYLSE